MNDTAYLQQLLDRLQSGEDTARAALLEHSMERLRMLARRMFNKGDGLRGLYETDDVLQPALLRLHRALAQIKPPTVRELVGLAARQVRFVLGDLARGASKDRRVSYMGEAVPGENAGAPEPQDRTGEPSSLVEWGEFHARIERLPEDEKEMFDLLFYEEMTQEEAAQLLGVSLRTVKRRWQSARLRLQDAMRGEWPSLEEGR